jgi:hypothetical protein
LRDRASGADHGASRGLSAYAVQFGEQGFGLIELGMHASAVCNDLVNDALQLVLDAYEEPAAPLLPAQSGVIDPDGVTVYEWNAGTEPMRFQWLGKLYLQSPKAWRWMRVRAETYNELQVNVYANGSLLYQRVVTSEAAFRLPLSAITAYQRLEVEVVGADRVYSIEIADTIEEFA